MLTHSTSRHQTGALPVHTCLGEALDCAAMRASPFCIGDINGENAAQFACCRVSIKIQEYVNSFPFSCRPKALCSDLVVVMTRRAKKVRYSFHKRCRTANVARWGQISGPGYFRNKCSIDTAGWPRPILWSSPCKCVSHHHGPFPFRQGTQFITIENTAGLSYGI